MRHSVSIFPVRAGGEILLQLRDDRPDLVNPNLWATLGGSIEAGETPEEAAGRELEEEIGRRPPTLIATGFVDGPSVSYPGEDLRIHLFGAAVDWALDELILGEGQKVDWFPAADARNLPLAPPIELALKAFLHSEIYHRLAAAAPTGRQSHLPRLPRDLMHVLGLRPGDLLSLRGANAGFVHRLWEIRGGVRITTTADEWERACVLLRWLRDEAVECALQECRSGTRTPAATWLVAPAGGEAERLLLSQWSGLTFDGHEYDGVRIALPGDEWAIRVRELDYKWGAVP